MPAPVGSGLAAAALILGGGAAFGFSALPAEHPLQGALFLGPLIAAAVLLAIRVGAERGRLPGYWLLLLAGVFVYAAASLAWYLLPVAWDEPLPFPSAVDGLYFTAYAFYAAFLVRLLRDREDGEPEERRSALMDAALLTAAACAGLWLFVIAPNLRAEGITAAARMTALAYPFVTALLLGLALRLAMGSFRRAPAELLLALWLGAELLSDVYYGYAGATGTFSYDSPLFLGWIVSYSALAALALHPALPDLSGRRPVRPPGGEKARRARLSALLVAALLPIALIAVAAEEHPWALGGLLITAAAMIALVVVRLVLLAGDLSEQRRLAARLGALGDELRLAAVVDPLTGLGNRATLAEALADTEGAPQRALVVVDLDNFKDVNDTFGHGAGDAVLREVGRLLRHAARAGDVVVRVGGDEFAVLVRGAGAGVAREIATRLVDALATPVRVGEHRLFVRASVGIAGGGPETDAATLTRNADAAMYAVKSGDEPVPVAVYAPERHSGVLDNIRLSTELGAALDRGELDIHYQPIVETATGRIVGCEALVRWRHPRRGWVPPSRFIPLAERTGAIRRIGAWVLEEACRDAAGWRSAAGPPYVTVNLSVHQLRDPRFPEHVDEALARAGLEPSRLVVELTETAMATRLADVAGPLTRLRRMGVRVLMDDFGTGYSSLGNLRSLPLDGVKIDRSFVAEITSSDEQWSIALTILRMLAKLGLTSVVEGMETAAQVAQMRSLGCALAQGYHFSRPVPREEIAALLERGSLAGGALSAAPGVRG